MKKTHIDQKDVESRLSNGESLRSIAKHYGITHQSLSMRRRAWASPIRKRKTTPGNRFVDQWGYTMVRTSGGERVNPYVAEHIIVAEKMIGRNLNRGEVVHHINGIKSDNREENLIVCRRNEHRLLHAQLESLAFEMVRVGQIVFDGKKYKWL